MNRDPLINFPHPDSTNSDNNATTKKDHHDKRRVPITNQRAR